MTDEQWQAIEKELEEKLVAFYDTGAGHYIDNLILPFFKQKLTEAYEQGFKDGRIVVAASRSGQKHETRAQIRNQTIAECLAVLDSEQMRLALQIPPEDDDDPVASAYIAGILHADHILQNLMAEEEK